MKKSHCKLWIVGAAVAALALAACVGCSSNGGTDASDASGATQESEAAAVKTLEEYVAAYPLEGESFMQARMSGTYDAFYKACTSFFGLEDVPTACAACHARETFNVAYDEKGNDCLDDNASDYDLMWSNCTNCHVGDPGDGVVSGGNLYGELTSTSASKLFSEEDYVCGQCHAMFPGATYMEDANSGIDQYKYGCDPDGMLKAMQEYFAENEITSTSIGAGMVGAPYYDEAIGTVLYLTDPCTALEVLQGSTHQSMGLTCTDCHMVQSTSEEGAAYTNHNMTSSPLENPDALKKCLTCHESQGIKDADAMVEFVTGKMSELGAHEQQTKADLDVLYGLLSEAVANGGVDGATLTAAQEAYNRANVYYLFQGGSSSEEVRSTGKMAAMNFDYCTELLDEADVLIKDATASLS